MIALTAISSLRIAPDDLGATMRDVLAQPLRREGTLAKLCVTGIVSCIGSGAAAAAADNGRTALIWGSAGGARTEVDKVLDEICRRDSLPMPFDFIASQCGVAAVYATRYMPDLACGAYLPSGGNLWQQVLCLAVCWLQEQRYDRVLCGVVDQAPSGGSGSHHASDWALLSGSNSAAHPLARVSLPERARLPAQRILDSEFIPSLQRWLDSKTVATMEPLAIAPIEFHRI